MHDTTRHTHCGPLAGVAPPPAPILPLATGRALRATDMSLARGFSVNEGKGFGLHFANGLTLSTQIGAGNYCDNYHGRIGGETPRQMDSRVAELAVIGPGPGTDWRTREMMAALPAELTEGKGDDDVVGYAPIELWLAAVNWCAAQD